MNKLLRFFCMILFCVNGVVAQNDTLLEARIRNLEIQLDKTNAIIFAKTNLDIKKDKDLIDSRCENIKASTLFLRVATKNVDQLISLSKEATYYNYIKDFNSATSDQLGFRLQDEIKEYLKPVVKIIDDEGKSSFLSGILNTIINNPIVKTVSNVLNNPIVKTVSSLIPAGGVLNTVSSIVSSVLIEKEETGSRQVMEKFQKDLGNVFSVFEITASINNRLSESQMDIKMKSISLDHKIRESLVNRIEALYSIEIPDTASTKSIVIDYCSGNKISDRVDAIRNGKSPSELILERRLYFSPDGKDEFKEIYKEYAIIYSQYLYSFKENYELLREFLSNSENFKNIKKDDPQKRMAQIERLNREYEEFTRIATRHIDGTNELKTDLESIKDYYVIY